MKNKGSSFNEQDVALEAVWENSHDHMVFSEMRSQSCSYGAFEKAIATIAKAKATLCFSWAE